jgi:hypothetical protein
MRITHFPTPWDEHSSSQRVRFYTVLSSGGNAKSLKTGKRIACSVIGYAKQNFL